MNKKAQAAVFIIIALSIMIFGAMVIINRTSISDDFLLEQYQTEEVPKEFDALKDYITDCLNTVSIDGIKSAGSHGGYLAINDPTINREFFTINPEVTESETVIFSPGSDYAIPYWWYLESDNECRGVCNYNTKMPLLRDTDNSVELQLERYIEQRLKNCVGDYSLFKNQGFSIEEVGDISVNVIIGESDVTVLLDYPIDASKTGKARISKYYTKVDVDLEKIFELAMIITAYEQQYHFLERAALNLIAGFSSIDENRLPPTTGTTFQPYSSTRWIKSDVQQKLTDALMSYISLFQVYGTKNYEHNDMDNLLKMRVYEWFIVPMQDESFNDLEAHFNYLDFWPIYFDLNCRGEVCEPDSVNMPLLPFIGLQRYNFKYDVSFPVLVEINDPDAFNGRGFPFRFFLEANVRNNEPLSEDFNPYNITAVPSTTMLCNQEQLDSEDISIIVRDSITRNPVEDVNVLFNVADESCPLGTTDNNGVLITKMPLGNVGSFVSFIKRDFITKSLVYNPSAGSKRTEMMLDPVFEKKVVVKKKKVVKSGDEWNFVDQAYDLYDSERAIVTLERIGGFGEEEFISGAEYPGTQYPKDVAGPSTIRIGPGEYNLRISMIDNDEIIIPEEHVEEDTGLVGELLGEDVKYTLPEMRFGETQPYPSGGLNINFTVNPQTLLRSDTIEFFVVSADLKGVPQAQRKFDDLDQMSMYDQYSGEYSGVLQPVLK